MEILEKDILELAESIINTIRHPLIVLDKYLRVITASRSFYEFFKVKPEETIGQLVYDLGNNQWDIPKLRELLESILPNKSHFDNYIVEHNFEAIGRRIMVLNASQMQGLPEKEQVILLALEDISQRRYFEVKLEKVPIPLEVDNKSISRSLEYTQGILNTIRESLIVLDNDLRILFASRFFYEFFKVKPEETIGKLIYNIGNNQWDMPKLRELLESILPHQITIENYELELDFMTIGKRIMLINARQIQGLLGKEQIILLAIEDITEAKQVEEERIRSLARFPDENPHPVLRISKEGKIIYANEPSRAMLNMWGKSVGENVPTNWKNNISKSFKSGDILEFIEIVESNTFSFILLPITEMDYLNVYGKDITDRDRAYRLLNSLNEASTAMESILDFEEVFSVINKQLKEFGFFTVLFQVDETQTNISPRFLSMESKVFKALEKLLGLKMSDLWIPIESIDVFSHVVQEKETVISENIFQLIKQMMPHHFKKIVTIVPKYLKEMNGIFAPLIIEDAVKWVLGVSSKDLTKADIQAITAFAHEMVNTWNRTKLIQDLKKTIEGTIHILAATVETRDPYTAGHQENVSELAVAIANEMHLTEQQVEGIRMAGLIHDLGKIQVPAEILSKPGKISELEFELIKIHPQVGYDLLKDIEFSWPIADIVHQHHEKMDGSGYPQGLKGDEILIEARILTVADIVEAMSSHRPYRPALGIKKALDQIKQDRGVLLDTHVVDACLKIFKEGYQLPED